MKLNICLLLVSVTGLSLMSCGQPNKTKAADFLGIYVAKFSHGSEILTLKPDGTYEQTYIPSASTSTQTNAGGWIYRERPNAFIHLQGALLFDTRSNQPQIPPTRTDLALNVKMGRNGVELVINDDEGLGYRKQTEDSSPNAPK